MSNKKTYAAKRKVRDAEKKKSGLKEHGSVKGVASAILLAIVDGYISYRQFKEVQAIIDAKYWKPEWVPEKVIKND
jgi:ribosomal protein L27